MIDGASRSIGRRGRRVGQDHRKLGRLQAPVQNRRDRAEARAGELNDDHVDTVAGQHADPVALPHAARGQNGHAARDAVIEAAIGPARTARQVRRRQPLGARRGMKRHEIPRRLGTGPFPFAHPQLSRSSSFCFRARRAATAAARHNFRRSRFAWRANSPDSRVRPPASGARTHRRPGNDASAWSATS